MPPYGTLVPCYVIPRELYGYVKKIKESNLAEMSLNTSGKIRKSFLIMNEALV